MKNRQLGNGFPTIRAIRFFLSVFSIYQRLQNWRSLLINMAGCSCSDSVLLHTQKNKNKRRKLLCCIPGKEEGTTLCFISKKELQQVKLLLCSKLLSPRDGPRCSQCLSEFHEKLPLQNKPRGKRLELEDLKVPSNPNRSVVLWITGSSLSSR